MISIAPAAGRGQLSSVLRLVAQRRDTERQEINASDDEPLSCVICRSGQEPVVVNLDLPNVEANPEQVHWVDNIHSDPTAKRGSRER